MTSPTDTPPKPSINFSEVYTLLSQYQQTNNSLILPVNEATSNRIIDILTVQGIEKIASQRWNTMSSKINGSSQIDDEESKEWLKLQRTPYLNYEKENTLQPDQAQLDQQLDDKMATDTNPNPLTEERFDKLKNADVAMNRWEARLMELKQYYAENGNCDVPIDHPGGLGLWVATQRISYRFDKATMPQGRIDALDAMGFIWQSKKRQDSWGRYFDELVEYIRQHGTSHVSAYEQKYSQLGSWVKRQRSEYKKYMELGRAKSQMTKERIDKLESIGFQWRLKPEKTTWEDRFETLKQYRAIHGHCRPTFNENQELNTWSRYQRLNYQYFMEGKPSRLTQAKVDKLTAIGINDPINPNQVIETVTQEVADSRQVDEGGQPDRMEIAHDPMEEHARNTGADSHQVPELPPMT